MKQKQRQYFRVALLTLIVGCLTYAPATFGSSGQGWDAPITIHEGSKHFTDYQTLYGTGGVAYYQFTISQPTTVHFRVGISRLAPAKFAPQIALFVPNTDTIGPLLPIVQPPQSLAQVYPMTPTERAVDIFTQTVYTSRVVADPTLTVLGTYRLAVYNAGSDNGTVRFDFDRGQDAVPWMDIWRLPVCWWNDQLFAGFSWLTLITPVLVIVGLWLVSKRLVGRRVVPTQPVELITKKRTPQRTVPKKTIVAKPVRRARKTAKKQLKP